MFFTFFSVVVSSYFYLMTYIYFVSQKYNTAQNERPTPITQITILTFNKEGERHISKTVAENDSVKSFVAVSYIDNCYIAGDCSWGKRASRTFHINIVFLHWFSIRTVVVAKKYYFLYHRRRVCSHSDSKLSFTACSIDIFITKCSSWSTCPLYIVILC